MPNVLNIQPTQEVEFRKGSTATNPIPPPGQPYDGRASENLSALYPSTQQSTLITLTGSTAEGDVTTLTVTPNLMATGSAWADNLGPIVVSHTSGVQAAEVWEIEVTANDDGDYKLFDGATEISTFTASGNTADEIRDGLITAAIAGYTGAIVGAGVLSITRDVVGLSIDMSQTSPNANANMTVTLDTAAAGGLDGVAKGLVQALTDAQTVTSLDDIANFQRISELIQWSSPGADQILLVSQLAGATFSYSISSTGSVTDDGGVTTGTDDEPLYVGMAAAIDSYKNDGTPVLRPVQAGDTADQLVLVMDSIMCEPLEAGSPFRYYKRNKDVAWRHFGSASAWCGQAVTAVNSAVSVRLTTSTGGSEPLGELLVSDPGDGTTLVAWTGKTFLRTSTAGICAIDIPHP